MRITERKLRNIIKSVINESADGHLSPIASDLGIDIYCHGSDKTHFLLYVDTKGVTGKYAANKMSLIEEAIEKQLGEVLRLDDFNYLCKFPSRGEGQYRGLSQTPEMVAKNILFLASRY